MQNTLIALVVALVLGGIGGWTGGYRYATGRAAVAAVAERNAVLAQQSSAIDDANRETARTVSATVESSRRDAKLAVQHHVEELNYEHALQNADCALDAAAWRLFNDALRRANANINAAARGVPDDLP